jgi:hypothetical protein
LQAFVLHQGGEQWQGVLRRHMYDPWNKCGTPMDHLTAERPALRALVRGAALTTVTTTCITVAPLSTDELTVAQVDGGKVRGTAANGLIDCRRKDIRQCVAEYHAP